MSKGSNRTGGTTPDAKDKAVYASVVQKHYRQVFAVCLGMLGNVHDAEDAAQETMLRGLQKMPNHEDQQGVQWWLLRVARNCCVDLLRKRKRQKPPAEPPPVQARQDQNALYDLDRAVTRLPMELRVPLLMYYFDGRKTMHIAESLKISYATACQRLRQARRQLHELMTEGTQT